MDSDIMKYIYLSHLLKNTVPVYGGQGSLSIRNIKSLDNGDSANIFYFSMENHWGTHVDCPAHFFKNGQRVTDYPAGTWFFKRPLVLSLKLDGNSLICPEDIGEIPDDIDLLLIRSSFSYLRGTEKYVCDNPGLKPEVGVWLRERHPSVRAVGIDFISLSPYRQRNLGREAHRAFLDPEGINNPILIIEDMDLSPALTQLDAVWIFPLLIADVDSAPCTVIGAIED